jgi:transcriptional regulator with XRE-family HTH domain
MDAKVEPYTPVATSLCAEIAAKLRTRRQDMRLTLKQVAERCDTTPQTIQRIEVGVMTISTYWIDKIAHALELDPRRLFTDDELVSDPRIVIRAIADLDVFMGEARQLRAALQKLVSRE